MKKRRAIPTNIEIFGENYRGWENSKSIRCAVHNYSLNIFIRHSSNTITLTYKELLRLIKFFKKAKVEIDRRKISDRKYC